MHFGQGLAERKESFQLETQTWHLASINLDFARVLVGMEFLNYLELPIIP